jgi:hypothetical protein
MGIEVVGFCVLILVLPLILLITPFTQEWKENEAISHLSSTTKV